MAKADILIVEDESIVALDIRSRLSRLGYAVPAIASSGEQAVRRAAELSPDLVLMDIQLKGEMDGVQAAEAIRTQLDTPVVYLTAYADSKTLERAKLTEPFGYILKPFEERDLRTTIEIALYKHGMERKLKESERWLATTLNSIGDAVIATDALGCIRFMNPVAEALTGWRQEEVLGQDLTAVFHIIDGEARTPAENPVSRVLREERVVWLENNTLLITRGGAETHIDDSAAPIRGDNGEIIGVVMVFRDVTQRKQAEEALRRYAAELEARNEELDAFSHTVAHDLKGPLGHMVGFAELLEGDGVEMPDEERREHLRVIANSGRRMCDVIDSLLLLAGVRRMEKAQLKPLDMGSIVDQVCGRLRYMSEEYQAGITLPDTWPVALGHAAGVEEVWVNYLSNAIKYGGRPPEVELGATLQPGGMVRFWVRDDGAGLTPEEQRRLFTPFTRLEQVRVKGYGLGLSIVRRIVEKLGGQVGVESEVGRGSEFSFTLPRVAGEGQVVGEVSCRRDR